MCTVNHDGFARPGYLIDARVESLAANALFTRLLAHHVEVGLTEEQIVALLGVAGEYHAEQLEVRIEFAQISEQLELRSGRLDDDGLAARAKLLDRHAELFRRHEELFFIHGSRGRALLSDDQIDRAEAVYQAEKDASLAALLPSLDAAVGPKFAFRLTASS